MAVAFSEDGQRVAIGSFEYELGIYDVRSGEMLQFHRSPPHTVTSLVFLPGGELLATGSLDGTVKLWDLLSGHSPIFHPRSPIRDHLAGLFPAERHLG